MNLTDAVSNLSNSEASDTLTFLTNLLDANTDTTEVRHQLGMWLCGQSYYRETFTTPFDQHKDRRGQKFTVLRAITEPDKGYPDEEVLPLFRIRFEDGYITDAWPEEVLTNP